MAVQLIIYLKKAMIYYYIINNNSVASQYGIGTYNRQLFKVLNKMSDIRISYIDLYSISNEFEITKDNAGCCHYNIPMIRNLRLKSYLKNASYFLTQVIPNRKNMVFHFNYFENDVLALLLKEAYIGCRIIVTIHYMNWSFPLKGNVTKFNKLISYNKIELKKSNFEIDDMLANRIKEEFANEKKSLKIWDEIIVLSKFSYDLFVNIYNVPIDKLHIVYNGLEDFKYNESKNTPMSFLLENFCILFVGRLDDTKGLEYLIKAFDILSKEFDNIKLIIVGDGNLKKYLSLCSKLRNKVLFTGKISHEELIQYYKYSKLGVLPSFTEQCSYSVIEMMKYSLPIIISDSTGLKEMLSELSDNIVHINEKNFSEDEYIIQIAKKIRKHIINEDYRINESRKSRLIFENRYHIDKMKNSLYKVIDSSLKRRQYYISNDFLIQLDLYCVDFVDITNMTDIDINDIICIIKYLIWRKLNHEFSKQESNRMTKSINKALKILKEMNKSQSSNKSDLQLITSYTNNTIEDVGNFYNGIINSSKTILKDILTIYITYGI